MVLAGWERRRASDALKQVIGGGQIRTELKDVAVTVGKIRHIYFTVRRHGKSVRTAAARCAERWKSILRMRVLCRIAVAELVGLVGIQCVETIPDISRSNRSSGAVANINGAKGPESLGYC